MLKVTVELYPGGSAESTRTLAAMTVTNLSDLADVSDYEIVTAETANPSTGEPSKMCWHRVHDYARGQSVWKLVGAAIAGLDQAGCMEM
ncbi:hypothetical protein [Bradyrhizobium sp. CCBAU 53338]|uniref:hypothetical protein n=1 Tax=Bradyrhizobium sp. CCBAU 53338 TaxID=1325111 RepID=UPI001889F108|nr:hypothetical protein [Bradyrhizobium sp. CCBAU 53338]QOZ51599.1 hypothetical protein XH90_09535 [Bradyrhizobium sp. CCBAU 53338]